MNQGDRQSQAWKKTRAYAESQIRQLRIRNEADLDLVATAQVRGQIKAMKSLLAWGTPDPAQVANDDLAE